MSVLVKNMKMPKDCPGCPMAHWNKIDRLTGCDVVGGKRYVPEDDVEYWNSDHRPDWCPLVDVPTPHGRLIDADALAKTIAEYVYPVADYFNSRDYGMFWTGGIEKAINEQSTIIEAEG